jgi:hypothetical protein
MATQLPQTRTAGRIIVRSLAVGIIGLAGMVGISVARFSSHPQMPTAPSQGIVATHPALGIDAPAGADLAETQYLASLPDGYTDYIRHSSVVVAIPATNPALGIDAPVVSTFPSCQRGIVTTSIIRRTSL